MRSYVNFIVAALLLVYACSTEQRKSKDQKRPKVICKEPVITNPNGMSEMSIIMEEWYTNLENIFQKLSSGKQLNNIPDTEVDDIYKAQTSKPNVHSEQFDAFVRSYYYNYSQLSKAGSIKEQISEFNLTVRSCLNCHEQYCHGPMVRIKKLVLKVE